MVCREEHQRHHPLHSGILVGARDPEIDTVVYIGEAIDAMDVVLPEFLPGKQVCITILQTLVWAYFDRRAFRQSDLDALHKAFDDAVDVMEA
jgi:hypothetical protein